jgi:CheY-like chemotaxis protein
MSRILVVEDEIFVAADVEHAVAEMGHEAVGIAADSTTALSLAPLAEVALVDLNLLDGPTGAELGRRLSETFGISVIYMTANPSQLGQGVKGTIGVLPKPVSDAELKLAVNYAIAHRQAAVAVAVKPSRLRLFDEAAA